MSSRSLEARLEALEARYAVHRAATLPMIIEAAMDVPGASERLAECDPASPLLVLIAQCVAESEVQRAIQDGRTYGEVTWNGRYAGG